jgi:hypothetical protein
LELPLEPLLLVLLLEPWMGLGPLRLPLARLLGPVVNLIPCRKYSWAQSLLVLLVLPRWHWRPQALPRGRKRLKLVLR